MRKLKGLWIGKTGDANAWYHIYPFARSAMTESFTVVRHRKPLREIEGVEYFLLRERNLFADMLGFFRISLRAVKLRGIDYVVAFNPVPWGAIAWCVAKIRSRPIILGFIGEDFYTHATSAWYRVFVLYMARHSDLVTVTGTHMKDFFLAKKIDSSKIRVFPHCVPFEWFENNQVAEAGEFDLITVCYLEKRKRVSDIIEALSILHEKGHRLSLCIVGDGPEWSSLGRLVAEKGLDAFVTMVRHVDDVLPYLRRSRIYVQASENEGGLSLGLVEAMAAGLIPVATTAGSERDHIEDGKNGFLVPIGEPSLIAGRIADLENSGNYAAMKTEVRRKRHNYHADTAIKACDEMLETILRNTGKTDENSVSHEGQHRNRKKE